MPASPGLPARASRRAAAALLLLGPLLLAACGIVRSTTGIERARQGLKEANEAQAASSAPYELTLAQEYYDKAREEQAFNDYQTAEVLALKSVEYAKKAVEVATVGRPKKTPEGLLDQGAIEALPEQGEVEQQRQQQEEQEPVILPTGPTKVLEEDEVDLVPEKKDDAEPAPEGGDGAEEKGGGGSP